MKKYVLILGLTVGLLGWAGAKEPLFGRRDASSITLSDGRSFSTVYHPKYPGGAGPVAVVERCVWWASGEKLFRRDLTSDRTEAYLPWNGAKGEIRWLLPSEDGSVLVTTSEGEYVVDPMNPQGDGFGGYLRARLGDDTERVPSDEALEKLAGAIEEWQGVPYLYGGNTKQGIDCSAFVGAAHKAAGVAIPRTSGEIKKCAKGLAITDDLEWGDVISYPGHVAIYIGNGKTAETRGDRNKPGMVTKMNVWFRKEATVRRFVK